MRTIREHAPAANRVKESSGGGLTPHFLILRSLFNKVNRPLVNKEQTIFDASGKWMPDE